jgi:hypothetical protein
MKRLLTLIVGLSVVVAGCSDKPTGPSQTTTSTFTVPLTAANEVPQTVNADAGATVRPTIVLRVVRDNSGNHHVRGPRTFRSPWRAFRPGPP